MHKPDKITVFRLIYLLFTILTVLFSTSLLVRDLVIGIKTQIDFSLIIDMVAVLICTLFVVSIGLFILRSISSRQTLLMKNIVFKQDGSPFLPGVLITACAGAILCVLFVLMIISACQFNFFADMPKGAQLFIADVALSLGYNLIFCFIYYLAFRHESGTFMLI